MAISKLASNLKVTSYLSGDASSAKDIGWVDMRDYTHILVTATAAALTGTGVTAMSIIANSDSAGGGTDVTLATHAVGSAPDAAGDMLVLEADMAVAAASTTADLRYVSVKLTCDNAADNIVVTYIRGGARFAQDELTTDVVA